MPIKMRPCEICKAMIEPERIENDPKTRLCTKHARMIVKYGGEFVLTMTQERLGKVESLKRNYGSITPHWRRNTTALDKLRREHMRNPRAGGDDPG